MDIFDRMKVDVPVGELAGMRVGKFEVKSPDDWTEEEKKGSRKDDLVSQVEMLRMEMAGRPCRPGWYTRLSEGDTVWMSDTPYERRDHAEPVFHIGSTKSKRVIINGLGIGMVLSAALSYDFVEHVDVVEIDRRIIELIGPHYAKDPRVHLHHADAVKQMKVWSPGTTWDTGWTDIWPSLCADNLEEMAKFSSFYGPRCGFHGNWGEEICKRSVWENRHWDKTYLKFLTEEDKEMFSEEDAGEEDYYDDEDEDD